MSLLLSLLVGPGALAFAPSEDIYIGAEPYRVQSYTPDVQLRMRHSQAWQSFLEGEGEGRWMVRFDERAGTVHRAWGKGLALGDLSTEAAAEASVRAFLERNPGLAGVDTDELRFEHLLYDSNSQTHVVRFERLVDGVPVWRGGLKLIFRYGKLVMFDVATHPGASVDATPSLDVMAATGEAIARGPLPDAEHELVDARLVVLPLDTGRLRYHLAWEVRTKTGGEPPGAWVSHVDAHTGELLNVYNEVRFLAGLLEGEHDTRTVDGSTSVSPVPFARITSDDGGSTTTDLYGAFSLSGDSFTTDFNGTYVRVDNSNGSEGEVTFEGSSYEWSPEDATEAEIDSYIFLHHVREWALVYAPTVTSVVSSQLRSNVNIRSSCNAYWNGNVNFYQDSGSCNNTGRIADVNYHEWGHGFHYYSASGYTDGSIGEGIGDVAAFLQTDDSQLAPYFYKGYASGIRNADNTKSYPDDFSNRDVHANGTIFSGAMWDLWEELEDDYGDREVAWDVLSQLFADGIKSGPDIPGSYDAMVAADDDDGDLSNGTPHQCAIIDAFGLHGLGPGGTDEGVLAIQHTPIGNQLPWRGDHLVTADIINYAGDCVEREVEAATLWYSVDGGESWSNAAMEIVDGDVAEGAIPEQPDGTIVHYYITADSEDGDLLAGGEINPFSLFVGNLVELYCEDFEGGEGDYTHELVSGETSSGADDWHHDYPAGKEGDPSMPYSGEHIWGNDLGQTIDGQGYNGLYQSGKHNRLISPLIDITEEVKGAEAYVLQFARWLLIEDGDSDQAWVTVDGEESWGNYVGGGFDSHLDGQWVLSTHFVDDLDGDGALSITWELSSDERNEFGGWNVDDVCVYAWVPEPEPPEPEVDTGLGDTGLDEDTGDSDEPVDETPDDNTEDPGDDDGSVEDPADDGDAGVDSTNDSAGLDLMGKGCGCSSSAPLSPAGGLFGLLLGAAALTRRRRR
jgi:MYXO-CTERM domain-containing protein